MTRSTRWPGPAPALGLDLSPVETAASETRPVTPAVIGARSLDIGYSMLQGGRETSILCAVQVPS
jgi:hypothetical protein